MGEEVKTMDEAKDYLFINGNVSLLFTRFFLSCNAIRLSLNILLFELLDTIVLHDGLPSEQVELIITKFSLNFLNLKLNLLLTQKNNR